VRFSDIFSTSLLFVIAVSFHKAMVTTQAQSGKGTSLRHKGTEWQRHKAENNIMTLCLCAFATLCPHFLLCASVPT